MNEGYQIDPTPELPDDTLISRVQFPTRIQNALSGAGLRTVGEVREEFDVMLRSLPDLGQASVTHFARPWACRQAMASGRGRNERAGLPQCTAHGLKKAGATIAAENGATTRQLMAMFDWDSPAVAEVYPRSAEQKRQAGDAMFLISLESTAGEA
jgi:hypothetical protein